MILPVSVVQRRSRFSLFALLTLLSVLSAMMVVAPASAEDVSTTRTALTFTVDVTRDAVDVLPGDGLCETSLGVCSLRAAVQETNASPGADVIMLPAGIYNLTVGQTGEDAAEQGDLDILDDLTITGSGQELTTITGTDNTFRVFAILSGDGTNVPSVVLQNLAMSDGLESVNNGGVVYTSGPLILRNVLVENGGSRSSAIYVDKTQLTVESSVFDGNNRAIYVDDGRINIANSQFINNTIGPDSNSAVHLTSTVGEIVNSTFSGNVGRDGGAIYGSANDLDLIGNAFDSNSAEGYGSGGAIYFSNGTYSLVDNTFTNNSSGAQGSAGAIVSRGDLYIENNSFNGNKALAGNGGAISVTGGSATIIDSQFEDNTAETNCGAVETRSVGVLSVQIENSVFRNNTAEKLGGAVCMDNAVQIRHSELSGNNAELAGGAIYTFSEKSKIINSSISGNTAPNGAAIYSKARSNDRLNLEHVTLYNNASEAGGGASIYNEQGRINIKSSIIAGTGADFACLGSIVSNDYNVISDDTCEPGSNDMPNTDPLLATLAGYGETQAHKPLIGSPVLGAIPLDVCPDVDQAFKGRVGLSCDIGAVQLNGLDVDKGVIEFSSTEYNVSELAGTATLNVSRKNGSHSAVAVTVYDSNRGTADYYDYTQIKTTELFWPQGDAADKEIVVSIRNDYEEEGDETITFSLVTPLGGAIAGLANTATLTIKDDETSSSVFAFTESAVSVEESARELIVSVVRTVDTVGAASVDIATVDGSAIGRADYGIEMTSLQFAPGEASKDVVIRIVDDNVQEGSETFSLVLSNPTNSASLGGPSEMTVTIIGSDNAVPESSGGGTGNTDDAVTSDTTGTTGTAGDSTTAGTAGSASGEDSPASTTSAGSTAGESGDTPANDEPATGILAPSGGGGGGGAFGYLLTMLLFAFVRVRRVQ